mgnify:CR=1 FL=1
MYKFHSPRKATGRSLDLTLRESSMKLTKAMFAVGQAFILCNAMAQAQRSEQPVSTNISLRPSVVTVANPIDVTPAVSLRNALTTSTVNIARDVRRGGESGGGGSYVLVDGEIMISDNFYQSMGTVQPTPVRQVSYDQLPTAVKRATTNLIHFFNRAVGATLSTGAPLTNILRGQYFLVPKGLENQAFCNNYLPNLNRSVDDHFRFGCTNGNITFLFIDAFERPGVTLREQAYALLHERLWSLKPGVDQAHIAGLIRGLRLMEDWSNKQEGNNDYWPSREEISAHNLILDGSAGLGIKTVNAQDYNFTVNGGLLNKNCEFAESDTNLEGALIGVASRIDCFAGRKVTIENSKIIRSYISKPESIIGSTITATTINANSYYDDRTSLDANTLRFIAKFPLKINSSHLTLSNLGPLDVTGTQITNTVVATYLKSLSSRISDSNLTSNGMFMFNPNCVVSKLEMKTSVGGMYREQRGLDQLTKISFKADTQVSNLKLETQLQDVQLRLSHVLRGPDLFGIEIGERGTLRRRNVVSFTDENANQLEYAVDQGIKVTTGPR